MYLYFDNKGTLKTKIDHGEKARQGSPLKVTVCLDTDFFDNLCHVYGYAAKYKHIYNWGLSVDLCKNGEHDPFCTQSVINGTKKAFIKEYDGEVTYDLQNFKQYIMYDITIPANQSTQLGVPFEMVFTLFTAPLAETDDDACDCPVCHPTEGSEEVTDSYSHKLAVVYVEVEKTFGQVSYKVTVSQYQNMLNTIRSFAQQYVIDEEPLEDSDHLVKSGGVKSALDTLDDKIDLVNSQLDSKIDLMGSQLDSKIDLMGSQLDSKINLSNSQLNSKIDLASSQLDSKIDLASSQLDSKIDLMGSQLDSKIDLSNSQLSSYIGAVSSELSGDISSVRNLLNDTISSTNTRFNNVYTKSEIDSSLSQLGTEVESHAAIQNISGTLSTSQIDALFDNYSDGIYRINSEEFGPETVYIHHKNVESEGDEDYFKRYTAGYAYSYDFDLGDWQIASGGGGGGGGTGGGAITLTARSALTQTVALGAETILSFFYRSTASSTGTAYLYADQVLKQSKTIIKGENSFDVTDLVKSVPTSFRIVVNDTANNSASLTFVVSSVELKITSTFDDTLVKEGETIQFVYTPYGGEEKTIHYILDGVDTTETFTSSGSDSVRTHNITNLTHGVHSFRVYMTSVVNGTLITSNTLSYQIIYNDGVSDDIIIASKFDKATASEGELISIDYIVYSRQYLTTTVSLSVNGVTQQSNILTNRAKKFWNLTNYPTGNTVFTITAVDGGSHTASKSFTVAVSQAEINVTPVSSNLVLYLANNSRNNGEAEPQRSTWTYGSISASLTNFNWASNGWVTDEQGYPILRVNGQAQVSIPLKIFENANSFENGKTIEINFKIQDVVDTSNVLMSCFNNSIGFKITSNEFIFNGGGQIITTKFKEEEKIKISLSIQSANSDRLIKTYINGVLSGIVQYEGVSNFIQANPVNITINPNQDGFIDIYSIRVYNNALSNNDILNNYIADQNLADKLVAFRQNDIFDSFGSVSYAKIKDLIPVLIIEGPLPAVKGDKQIVVCSYEDPLNENNNFYYEGCSIDVQGTSSQYYPRKNYKIKFPQKFSLYEGAVQEKSYTFKADFMESSHSHNTGAAKIISELSPANPKQIEGGPGVRNSIYGFPIVIFHRDSASTPLEYYGVFNFNNDKKNNNTIGLDDEHCESWEFKNNTSPLCLFNSDDFSDTAAVEDCFEARYPEFEDGHVNYTNLERVISWVYSTKNDTATFESEFEDYFNKDFCLFYYVMMEVLLAVDSRAKNMFLDTFDGNIWYPRWYDIDTIFGLNNEGVLDFSYDLEQHDTKGTGNVYNGEGSVFWNNFETVFADDIKAYYNNLRSNGLNYDYILSIIKGEQVDKISAAMYNSDSQFKYVESLLFNNENYLYAAQGSRIEHFKWWLQSRFNYLDSKYENASYLNDYVTMRLYTPASGDTLSVVPAMHSFNLIPYKGIYCKVKFGSTTAKQRGRENVQTTVAPPQNIEFNDTETIIYGASQLLSLGNLYNKYAGSMNLANATRIKDLKIGYNSSSYENTNLTELTLGNNELLQTIDVRGCTNLAGTLNLSGCRSIKTIYANRTALTYIRLPEEGGNLTNLYLPNTIQTLVIKDQPFLTNYSIPSYANLQTVELKNTPMLTPALIRNIVTNAPNLSNMVLTDINWTLDNDYADVLDILADPNKNITINGTIHVIGTVYEDSLNTWRQRFGVNANIIADNVIVSGDETSIVMKTTTNGQSVSIQISNVDSNKLAKIAVNWGDGTTGSFTNAGSGNSKNNYISCSHSFTTAGTYTVNFVFFYIDSLESNYNLARHSIAINQNYYIKVTNWQSQIFNTITIQGPNIEEVATFPASITLLDFLAYYGGSYTQLGYNVPSNNSSIHIRFEEPDEPIGLVIRRLPITISSIILRSDTCFLSGYNEQQFTSGFSAMVTVENNLYYLKSNDNDYYAFIGYNSSAGLTSISLNANTQLVAAGAFGNLYTRVTSCILNNQLKYIGYAAFYNYFDLYNLNIPASVLDLNYIKPDFNHDANIAKPEILQQITVDSNNTIYDSRNNCNAILKTETNELIIGCINTVIPNTTKIIGGRAFSNVNYGTYNLIIPEGVEKFSISAFEGAQLSELTLPSTLTEIGAFAFYNSSTGSIKVSKINIPNIAVWCKLKRGRNTFSSAITLYVGDSAITNIDIPNTVTKIDEYVFENINCNNIIINDSVTSLSIYSFYGAHMSYCKLGNGLTSIPSDCFYSCRSLTTLVWGDNITSVSSYNFNNADLLSSIYINNLSNWCNVSWGSNSITNVGDHDLYLSNSILEDLIIPNDAYAIKNYAFYKATSLETVAIHSGVASIGNSAFYGCSNITTITVNRLVPCSLGSNAFPMNEGLRIIVPSGTGNAYKAATNWSTYAEYIEEAEE